MRKMKENLSFLEHYIQCAVLIHHIAYKVDIQLYRMFKIAECVIPFVTPVPVQNLLIFVTILPADIDLASNPPAA